jgi:hypothetical protein
MRNDIMEAKNKDDKMKLSEIMKLNNVFFEFIKFLNATYFVNDNDFVIIMDNLNTYHNICKTKSPKITSNTFISSYDIKVCNLKLNNLKKNKTQKDTKNLSLEFLIYIKTLYVKYIENIQNSSNSKTLSNLSLIFLILESIRNILVNYKLD